ncbi:MAG: hypothetical protein DWC11_05655 [Candidatus Poseidoniales archaeon]|nr:MAG: hypothetical protein DWC11_05655 [Candidatus Poseidoniales archaeon]
MRDFTVQKDVKIQEGPAFPDLPGTRAGPTHQMEQALFPVVACSEAFSHRQGAVHVRFAFRPIEPFCFCVDVEGPDQPCIGRGA